MHSALAAMHYVSALFAVNTFIDNPIRETYLST